MDDLPHLALPLRLTGDRFAAVQQDTEEELATTVLAILSYQLGSRIERPDFGIPDPALAQRPLDLTAMRRAVAAFEPRADFSVTELPYDPTDPLASRVRVQVAMQED